MPEQWLNPATWSGAQWLAIGILVLAVVALAAAIYRLIGQVQQEMVKKRKPPVLRPSLRPDLDPSRARRRDPGAGDNDRAQ